VSGLSAYHDHFSAKQMTDGFLLPTRIQFLRDIRDIFGTSFKIVPADPSNPDNSELLLSCYGTGFINASKPVA
jgi:RNA 3'-terminal phosphate cyclase-like protein